MLLRGALNTFVCDSLREIHSLLRVHAYSEQVPMAGRQTIMGEVLQILVTSQQCGTMPGATLLRSNLLTAISENSRISLDISELGDVDLSFIQTVEAGRRHAAAEGGELTLSTGAGASLRDALDRSGFSTSFTAADRSFWFHED